MNNFRLIIRKNTPKLRNLLNNLGYHYNSSRDRIHSDGYIYVSDFRYYIIFNTLPTNCIDCGEDEELFIKYLYKHTECYIREHNKTELTINQKRLLEECINGFLNFDNNSLPVEEVDAEVVPFTAISNHGELIKNDNDELITKELDFILSDLSKDFKNKYEDKVVFIDDIPVEKQKEFIGSFKTNDRDIINTTLEIIMNDYSKDKTEIFIENKNGIIYDHSELDEVVTYPFYKRPDLPVTFCNMIGRKYGNFTKKHQPDKKSKKSARRNNRRAKRNNR